ncbi:DUF1254 domain-containing protein [Saccharopolyspora sp. NPDC049426]|uniref:DUF1254 domain-containing protein n=1 Tax=Saccharopolyspora sp. NPDC049426 TaxID=3155652 RepID=UPI00344579F4
MAEDRTMDLEEAARAVQVWAYPLVFAQRVRLNFTQPLDPTAERPLNSAGAPLNTFGHQRRLSDPTLTVGVAPNVDTLYSVAWLDVRHNDFSLKFPDFGTRYASFQLALPDTSTPITISAPAPGERLPAVSIAAGPEQLEVTDGEVRLRTPWRYVMVVGRILVEPEASDEALADVHRLQDSIDLQRLPVAAPPRPTFDLDGSLTIQISAARPDAAANWLPVPAGPFRLMLRLYRPTTTKWDPPPLVPAPRREVP